MLILIAHHSSEVNSLTLMPIIKQSLRTTTRTAPARILLRNCETYTFYPPIFIPLPFPPILQLIVIPYPLLLQTKDPIVAFASLITGGTIGSATDTNVAVVGAGPGQDGLGVGEGGVPVVAGVTA